MVITPYNVYVVEAKSDTVNFVKGPCDAIYVGGTGNVVVVPEDESTTVLFTAVPVGTVLPIRAKRINSTLTTGGPFVALYKV
jgi:hypothetical protein